MLSYIFQLHLITDFVRLYVDLCEISYLRNLHVAMAVSAICVWTCGLVCYRYLAVARRRHESASHCFCANVRQAHRLDTVTKDKSQRQCPRPSQSLCTICSAGVSFYGYYLLCASVQRASRSASRFSRTGEWGAK